MWIVEERRGSYTFWVHPLSRGYIGRGERSLQPGAARVALQDFQSTGMRDETESISVFRSSYMSVLATSREKLYSTLTLRRQNFFWVGRGGLKGIPAPATFLNNLISLIKRELNEKRAVITLVIEKLNVQIDCLFILSHCKL